MPEFASDVKEVLWTLARARYTIRRQASIHRSTIDASLALAEEQIVRSANKAGFEVRVYRPEEVATQFVAIEEAKRPGDTDNEQSSDQED